MKDNEMISKLDNKLTKILLGIFFILMLTSCHSKYINIEIRTDGSIAWNKDSSAFVFVARKRLYRMPKGIAKFPDGGKSKNEYLDFSIYLYDVENQKLTNLTDLNEFHIGTSYRWLSISQVLLSLNDSVLYYKMKKTYDYDLNTIKERYPDFLANVVKTYKVNLKTHRKEIVDTTVYTHLFNKKREHFKASIAKHYLGNLKYLDWGIDIKKLYPQSKSDYIDYIIEGVGSVDCIFQQIAPDFTEKDRKFIMEKMHKHKQKLYKKFDKYDKKKDPYRKSMAKKKYDNYVLYVSDIERKLSNY